MRRAWDRFWTGADSLGRFLTVAGILGVPGLTLVVLGPVGLITAVVVVVIALLFEGAYQVWKQFADKVLDRQMEVRATGVFRRACWKWLEEVERFLEARQVVRPDGEAGERHDRETVALYIERFRDQGVRIFDHLVRENLLVPTERANVRSPRTLSLLKSGRNAVQAGAERIPR